MIMGIKTPTKRIVEIFYNSFVSHINTTIKRIYRICEFSSRTLMPDILGNPYTTFSIKKTSKVFFRSIHINGIVHIEIPNVNKYSVYSDIWANSVKILPCNDEDKTEPSRFLRKVQRLYTQHESEEIVRTDKKLSELTRNALVLA